MDMKKVIAGLATSVTLVSVLSSEATAETQKSQRLWTRVASIVMDTKARNIDKGTPMGFPSGPDAPVRANFQIPSRGLVRVTVWLDPYYGGATRDLNTGGIGLGPAKSDGSPFNSDQVYSYLDPKEPTDGVPFMKTTIAQVDPCKSASATVTPPVAASGWAQLRCSIRALVEFSPGEARPGETFGPPMGSKTEKPSSISPSAEGGMLGNWKIDANGYGGAIQIGGYGGKVANVKMYYDVTGKWEEMTNVRYNPETGELSFTRPWAGNPNFQKYRGKLVNGKFHGTFTDTNSPGQQFRWNGQFRKG